MEELDPDEVINLERKMTRAMQFNRGITLKPNDLTLLAVAGAIDRLAEIKAQKIKEKVQWRQANQFIGEGPFGSTSIAEKEGRPAATSSTSIGTITPKDASAARARASAMFR